jgi:LysR family transcriptional regulator, benzoate and cis,cis-muconate-responsive activator of ben and cat genes
LDIRQLRSFVAVAHGLSFSRAAQHLHLSQPALSAQIKSLEDHLGARLFERNRRTVRITPAGSALLADAESLLQQIADTELRVARISTGEIGHLRIGFVASATMEIVPAIVLAFRRQYPGVDLELKNLPTVQQVEALRNGNLDAGFVRLPLAENGLTVTLIHREPFALVLAKTHRAARDKNPALETLAEEPFIAYGRRWAPAFYDVWTAICRKAGFVPKVVQETAEMSTALALVAAGLGVAILPEGITHGHRHLVSVKVLQREKIRSEIGIATLASRQTPVVQHLLTMAKQVAQR